MYQIIIIKGPDK